MLTEQHIKEGLSRAYVSAIVNKAGMDCGLEATQFDYGIDGCISDVRIGKNGRRSSSGFKIDFQLKSTINYRFENDEVIYKIEVKNYNDLIEENVGTPRILILYVLPENDEEWVSTTEERLILKNCAWWCSLKGKTITENTSTVTIRIPRKQLFTVNEVERLMSLVKEGEQL